MKSSFCLRLYSVNIGGRLSGDFRGQTSNQTLIHCWCYYHPICAGIKCPVRVFELPEVPQLQMNRLPISATMLSRVLSRSLNSLRNPVIVQTANYHEKVSQQSVTMNPYPAMAFEDIHNCCSKGSAELRESMAVHFVHEQIIYFISACSVEQMFFYLCPRSWTTCSSLDKGRSTSYCW